MASSSLTRPRTLSRFLPSPLAISLASKRLSSSSARSTTPFLARRSTKPSLISHLDPNLAAGVASVSLDCESKWGLTITLLTKSQMLSLMWAGLTDFFFLAAM